jgi:hypothetical protein
MLVVQGEFIRLSNAFTAWEDRPSVTRLGSGGVIAGDEDTDDADDDL